MDETKYHKISDKSKVMKVKSGRFTITPVDPNGTLNSLGPFLKTSQVFLENGNLRIIKGPEQKTKKSVTHHYIPKGARVTKIENGRLTITPIDPTTGSLSRNVSGKSTVTYKTGRFTIKKGPIGKRFHSVGGRTSKRKTQSSKRRSKRYKKTRIV
jgi:hypothetical protein